MWAPPDSRATRSMTLVPYLFRGELAVLLVGVADGVDEHVYGLGVFNGT